ncbi:MAG: caspase family protein, partial [Cyanobacteria bacterium P01_F01_bin.42]
NMQLNRRQFLKGCSGFLAGLGVLEGIVPMLSSQWGLAETAPRKLALLVGINQYQGRTGFPSLRGCITDVALMQNLLVYRFGFNPKDIHVLTNDAATRQAIEREFQTHLIDQAQKSDVVFFHFSGFGQYLAPSPKAKSSEAEYGLLPHDAILPAAQGADGGPRLNAILQETLYLLIRSLKTNRVVTVLDTGFQYPGAPTFEHCRVRSLPERTIDQVNQADIRLQDKLLANNKLRRSQFVEQRDTPPRGIGITAASLQQFGIEADWPDFSAGALTSALTQQMWHTAPNSSVASQVSYTAETLADEFSIKQQPELSGQKKSALTRDLLGLPDVPANDGVITDSRGQSGEVWLGGIMPSLLKTDKIKFILSVLTKQSPMEKLIQVNRRKGLQGTAESVGEDTLAIGDRVRERYRLIERNQPLYLALSTNLDKIEKIDATSVVGSSSSSVKVVKDDQAADVVLSKLERMTKESPSEEGDDADAAEELRTYYCLRSLAGDVLPITVSDRPEAVKNHYESLQPTFDVLRWRLCLEQLLNRSSYLSASAALVKINGSGSNSTLIAKSTTAAVKGLNTVPAESAPGGILTIDSESKFQLALTNSSEEGLYLYIFGFDAQPNAIMVYQAAAASDDSDEKPIFQPFTIAANSSLVLPTEEGEFSVYGPPGRGSLYILMTRSPLPSTNEAIKQATKKSANKGSQPKQIKISEPLALREALFSDLDSISQEEPQASAFINDKHWTLSVKSWAMMRFVFEVV